MATEESENGAENFPGLNKRHGFFKAIERNQRDRDLYHQQAEVSSLGSRAMTNYLISCFLDPAGLIFAFQEI